MARQQTEEMPRIFEREWMAARWLLRARSAALTITGAAPLHDLLEAGGCGRGYADTPIRVWS